MTRTTKATNKKLKRVLPISVRIDAKGAYYFKNWKAFNCFMNMIIATINLEIALNKPIKYPEPYIYHEAKTGIGKALIPELLRKAINNPIIL